MVQCGGSRNLPQQLRRGSPEALCDLLAVDLIKLVAERW
jgi:hypothetical protein